MRCLTATLLAAVLSAVAVVQAADELSGAALVEALQGGGFNLYFRHAATDWSQDDDVRAAGDWTSCDPARIRQLSERGRATARIIGDAMRSLAIPVGQVLASPYCRTVETAELMELGAVETTTAVINMRVADYFGGRQAVVASARALLARPPEEGKNHVIVAHGNVARLSTPVYPDEAEGVVFQPDGTGGFRVVGRLSPNDWARLARISHGPESSRRTTDWNFSVK
jgi:broad specificity phosphatase PhoE